MRLPIDPIRQKVYVEDSLTKRKRWLQPIDAREQLHNGTATLVESGEVPEPPKVKTVDYSKIPIDQLRSFAQEAQIDVVGKSRAQIEEALEKSDFTPPTD